MKTKFILIIGILAAMTSCAPLRIVMNSADKTGARRMLTSDVDLFGDFSLAMGAKIEKKDTVLAVLITSDRKSDHGIFDLNDRLMMRLSDNSEVILNNVYDKEYESNTETRVEDRPDIHTGFAYTYSPWTGSVYLSPYTIYRMVPYVNNVKTTKSYALYLISKQQIQDIIGKGVVKLRVEIEDSDCDMPDPERATAKFNELYTFLHNAAKSGVKRSEF